MTSMDDETLEAIRQGKAREREQREGLDQARYALHAIRDQYANGITRRTQTIHRRARKIAEEIVALGNLLDSKS